MIGIILLTSIITALAVGVLLICDFEEPAHPSNEKCIEVSYSSRVCERGTKCCDVEHNN